MKVIYETPESSRTVEVTDFYREIAEMLSKEDFHNGNRMITVRVSGLGYVSYRVQERSGTMFIVELTNTLPDSLVDRTVKPRFLTCVNPATNAYKFYKIDFEPNGGIKASYGRMGTNKGELFGERSYCYSASMYWIKYYEKLSKGYVDRSDLYLAPKLQPKTSQKVMRKGNGMSCELFAKLKRFAKRAVEQAQVSVPVTQPIINESHRILDQMRKCKSVDGFNDQLLELISILQRPVRTGDGKGVKRLMAEDASDFRRIIEREEDLIQAMEGIVPQDEQDESFDRSIEVYEATDKQKEQVMRHLADSLKPRVKKIYRVIPGEQQKRFNAYLKKNNITKVIQLWHGSRNQNWMSIIMNSLKLNPNAIITGKMFGHGIYFAPSSMKSWNYTSMRGTSWAHGTEDIAYMGLYAVAYGKPWDVGTYSACMDYRKETRTRQCNCLHAHAGSALKNDEIVFYDEDAMVLNYIVEFK